VQKDRASQKWTQDGACRDAFGSWRALAPQEDYAITDVTSLIRRIDQEIAEQVNLAKMTWEELLVKAYTAIVGPGLGP
jgi:hypothetical protein